MRSITLRMKPAPFQFGSAGWTSPLVLVQRTCKGTFPDCGIAICELHWRKLYLAASLPGVLGCHARPRGGGARRLDGGVVSHIGDEGPRQHAVDWHRLKSGFARLDVGVGRIGNTISRGHPVVL